MLDSHALLANVRQKLCDLLCESGASAAWVPELLWTPGVQIGMPHFRTLHRLTFSLEALTLHVWAPDEQAASAVRQLAPALLGRLHALLPPDASGPPLSDRT